MFTGTDAGGARGSWFSFHKADRRVTCYYFYLWDDDFGPAFIKMCAYFPYPTKIWINGHEWAKRQATQAGIGFTELSNGFARHRSRRAAGHLRPARPRRDHRVRRALVVDPAAAAHRRRPRRRLLVGAVDAPGRDVAHHRVRRTPPRPRVLRGPGGRQPRHRPPGADRADLSTRSAAWPPAGGQFKTRVVTHGTEVTVNAFYQHSRIKQYLKDGRALRIETVINDPDDLGCLRRLVHLDELQTRARAVNTRCSILNVSARAASLRVQPLSGSRGPPSPRTAGGPRPYGSATLGSKPWPAPSAPACSPSPASPTRACAP